MQGVLRLRRQLLLPGAGFALAVMSLTACGHNSTPPSESVSMIPAFAQLGQPSFFAIGPNQNNPGPSANTLNSPVGGVGTDVEFGGFGGIHFLIADSGNNRVLGWNEIPTSNDQPADFVLGQPDLVTGIRQAPQGGSSFGAGYANPNKVTISDDGRLVVTDTGHNRILIYNTIPSAPTAVPDVIIGQAALTGQAPGTSATTLTNPQSAMIAAGNLVVADTGNNRVLIWSPAPTSGAGAAATLVLGQSNTQDGTSTGCSCQAGDDFTDNGTATAPTRFNMQTPADIWTDGSRLLVADTGFDRVLYWPQMPLNAVVFPVTVTPPQQVIGQTAFTFTFSVAPSPSSLNSPTGIGSNGNGAIMVTDTQNNRALYYQNLPRTNGISSTVVLGQGDFLHSTANDPYQNGANSDTGGPHATFNSLNGPSGVTFVGNTAFVTDTNNNRVMFYNMVNTVTQCQQVAQCPVAPISNP
jgi:hypothetical protein